MMQVCTKCLIEKPIEAFAIREHGKRRKQCRECKTILEKLWLNSRRDEYNATQRAWRAKNREKCRQATRRNYYEGGGRHKKLLSNRASRYGVSQEAQREMLAKQNNLCAACGNPEIHSYRGGNLSLDHDHVTGEMRGFLCHGCNMSLGLCGDDPDRLRAIAAYLERHLKKAAA